MSHDQVELQRILSTTSNGSYHHGSSTTMSASGSVGSDHMRHHTDADDTLNPVYFSIPESQVAHGKYKASQLQPQNSTSPTSAVPMPSPGYNSPQTAQSPPTGSLEAAPQYDFIPDRHKARVIDSTPQKGVAEKPGMSAGTGAPGVLQADNVLYAGTEEAGQMRHKTLTMSNTDTFRRFHGEGSPEVIMEGKEYDRSCRGCAVLLWGGCVTALVVIALAAAALALAILFTGIVGVCSTACNGNTDASTSQSVQELMNKVDVLERLVENLNRTIATLSASSTVAVPATATIMSDVMSTSPTSETTPTTSSTPQDVVLSLSDVNLYMDCNTSIEQTCEIDPAFDDVQCTTLVTHRYLNPGEFIMDISCVRVASSTTEQNGLAFILNIDESANVAECLCYVLQLAGSAELPRGVITCGLRVTRCRTVSDINTNATLTQSP